MSTEIESVNANKRSVLNSVFVLLLSGIFLICCIETSEAAVINFGANGCTLQDAIRSANNDNSIGNCAAGSGHDTLVSPDVWTITLSSRLPTITSDMTITTTTPSGLLRISGDNKHPVMKIIGAETSVFLSRVMIEKGSSGSNRGAGIQINDAEVELENTIISFNSTTAKFGGGIHIDSGILSLNRSYIEFNRALNSGNAAAKGGAIYAKDADVTVTESRFVYNDARHRLETVNGEINFLDEGFGASIFMEGGDLFISQSLFNELNSAVHGEQNIAQIENSTFNRLQVLNWQDQRGHVFFTDFSSLTLNHVTMKSAFRIENSILNMTNSILKGDCNISASTSWIVDAGNLYNTNTHMCAGTGNLFYYPKLLSLTNNGGLTETFALALDSDAINAGDPTYCSAVDQRGETRDAACDIGAYEVNDYLDIEVEGSLVELAPHVHAQDVVYEVVVRNNSLSAANEFELDLTTNNATITAVDYSLCSSFPCVIAGIQGMQELTIPVQVSLASFASDF